MKVYEIPVYVTFRYDVHIEVPETVPKDDVAEYVTDQAAYTFDPFNEETFAYVEEVYVDIEYGYESIEPIT